jgi:predicted metallo-beta-lactamase superfamily hydrolase
VEAGERRVVIDPGIALGYLRNGLMPHPLQVAVGENIRRQIVKALEKATDVVFSHFHGDHVPLAEANPYQLGFDHLPHSFRQLRGWSKSPAGLSAVSRRRFQQLSDLMDGPLRVAEGITDGPLSFSPAVPHGAPDSRQGTVMMSRIEIGNGAFVHASDIQLLDATAVDRILAWDPSVVVAAGPPLYLSALTTPHRRLAWENGLRLAGGVETLILDHHLMRSEAGERWLEDLSQKAGKKILCAADFMKRPRELLEARRRELYESVPVPANWHQDYSEGSAEA